MKRRVIALFIAFMASGSLAACGSGSASTASQSTTTSTFGQTLSSGVYNGGSPSTPHYFVVLTVGTDGSVKGSVQYVFQDGQTTVVIPFTGNAQSGVATLNVGQIPNTGRSWLNATNAPSSISATYTSSSLNLGECSSYLSVQSLSQCDFTYSPNGTF